MDIASLLKDLQGQKYPAECPICEKVYQSFSGISYHVIKCHSNGHKLPANGNNFDRNSPMKVSIKEPLSYADSQRMVEFDIKGSIIRNLISEPLTIEVESEIIVAKEEEEIGTKPLSPIKTPSTRGTPRRRGRGRGRLLTHYKSRNVLNKVRNVLNGITEDSKPPLPVATFTIVPEEDLVESKVPERKTYFRFIEKPVEDLDDDIEYCMDEEDYIWLEDINEIRKQNNLLPVNQDVFEMLIDRLEKESHFETRTVTGDPYNLIDEDAVCSICCDGECSNSNVILFCDMCNLAVHQECYGVPYIPEGQWLCRKCLQSPSKPVECLLCPTKSGAFKQTDTKHWAHVVCALWIPEVCFANTVFLEPIDSIGNIPAARWKLICYICKKKQGACIQCFKTNCYTAFHVTCAQQGGLHMKIEAARTDTGQSAIKKYAYCDIHTPKHASPGFGTPCHSDYCSDDDSDSGSVHSTPSLTIKPKNLVYQTPSAKLKEVQKKLLEKQSFKLPAIHIPFVPAHRLSKIVTKVAIGKKSQFIQQLQAYWMLKRQSRNGVPLLQRLKVNTAAGVSRNQREDMSIEELSKSKELKEQLRFWQQLRHDLERVRLLIELIRKREKLKKEECRMKQQVVDLQLKPLQLEMERTLVLLQENDITRVFAEPVKPSDAPDYHEFITNPMDFSTMRKKLADYEYLTFDQFENDFNLLIQNCLDFNQEETVYYRAAIRMRAQCKPVLKAAKKRIKQAGIDSHTGLHMEKPPLLSTTSIDGDSCTEDDVSALVENPFMTVDDKIEDLEQKLNASHTITSALTRYARQKLLRQEIAKLKRYKRKLDLPCRTDRDDGEETTPSSKRRNGLKRQKPVDSNYYNGEVKVGPETSTSPPDTLLLEKMNTSLVTTPIETTEKDNERVSPVFLEPGYVERNPSPGRSRRSGILFKKKQYKPIKPSPLILYSSATTTSEDEARSPPLKLKLRLDTYPSESSKRCNGDLEATGIIESQAIENNDPNTKLNFNRSETLCLSNDKKRVQPIDQVLLVNGLEKHTTIDSNLNQPYNDREFEAPFNLSLKPSRKRSYTSSSANSDTESYVTVQKRKTSKRGRQKSSRSMMQEFSDLEGLEDIQYGIYMVTGEETHLKDPKLHPLDLNMLTLVWAKCKGYPSYPALTIDPNMPRSGYQSNGVPIPLPPKDVLQMNNDDVNYLILFFDARRTWQWLPRDKIEPLGLDSRLDEHKLMESKKPSMRKNVQEAYKRAIGFRRKLEVGESSDSEEVMPMNDVAISNSLSDNVESPLPRDEELDQSTETNFDSVFALNTDGLTPIDTNS